MTVMRLVDGCYFDFDVETFARIQTNEEDERQEREKFQV
jgi:hypothetical protein